MNDRVIQAAEQFVKNTLGNEPTGHDWFHIERVRKNAVYISETEQKGDRFIIEMAAILHDIPDEKLTHSIEDGERRLSSFLDDLPIDEQIKERIIEIIVSISFKGGNQSLLPSVEAEIVQDADRLDAIGAIGISRAFAYGGKKGNPIYDPSFSVRESMTEIEYREGNSSTIHHFYEKLLQLKNRLNTETARKIAEKRHAFMEIFLEEFYKDWNGEYENNLD